MFTLAQDTRVLDKLANDPSILPFVAPEGVERLDFSDTHLNGDRLDRVRFYHNTDETIGMFFKWSSPDVWELHMMAMPTARGSEAYPFAVAVIRDMFEQGAQTVWGYTPIWNERARAMHTKLGTPSGFGVHPLFGEVQLFTAHRATWTPVEPKYAVKNSSEEVTPNG